MGKIRESETAKGPGALAQPGQLGGKVGRRHDLDALRAIAMLLGICLHAMAAYSGMPWVVMDNHQNETLEKATSFIHGFRMQLFFLVSGFFTAMLSARYGALGMIRNRAARILLPFLICLLTLIPLIMVVNVLAVTANASHPQDPLFRAIQQDDAECVMGLLEKGSPSLLEETEKRLRMTPLTWAVLCESEPMTSLLLERGANPMAVSRSGENPLTLASMLGRLDLLKLLVEKGGDPFWATSTGNNPWKAAHQNPDETRTVVWLARGKTPEDMAALEQGRVAVVGYLDRLFRSRGITPEPPRATAAPEATKEVENLPGWMQGYFAWLASDQMVVNIGVLGINLLQENLLDHLWFLWFLWWLCLIHAGLGWIGRFASLGMARENIGLYPGLVVALALTWALQFFMNLDYYPRTLNFPVGPDYSSGLIPKPHVILYYAVFFFFGSWYFRLGDHACRLGRLWWCALPVAACMAFPLLFVTVGDRFTNPLLQTLFTWLMVVGAIGLAHRFFTIESRWFRYLADSSYWLYLMHLPLVVFVQWQLFYLPLPALVKAALVLAVAVPVLLGSYELLVRHTVVGRLLHGKNPVRNQDSNLTDMPPIKQSHRMV